MGAEPARYATRSQRLQRSEPECDSDEARPVEKSVNNIRALVAGSVVVQFTTDGTLYFTAETPGASFVGLIDYCGMHLAVSLY